jgi:uncharacterized protein YabE (DUF348 family)
MANRLTSTVTYAATSASTITPSDGTDLTANVRAIYVGGAGNLTVQMAGDASQVTFTAVSVGTLLPIQVSRVLATGTTATLLIGLN